MRGEGATLACDDAHCYPSREAIDLYHHCVKNPYVAENGLGARDVVGVGGSIDDDRIEYLRAHIEAMRDAVERNGMDVFDYTSWAPIDLASAGRGGS